MRGPLPWTDAEKRRAQWLALAVVLWLIALSPGRLVSVDVGARLTLARALWTHGTIFSDDLSWPAVETPWGRTTYYGMGQTLFLLPFDILGKLAGLLVGQSELVHLVETLPVVFLYAPLAGLLWWWAVVDLLAELGLPRRSALTGGMIFLGSTTALYYTAQSAQEESLVGALALRGLVHGLRWMREYRRADAAWVGFLSGVCFLCRVNSVFALLPTFGVLFDGWRTGKLALRKVPAGVGAAVAGASLPALLHLAFAYWRYGNVFSTGYDLIANEFPLGPIRLDWTWSLLFGLGKGIFILAPSLFLALYGMQRHSRRHAGLWAGTIAALVISAMFHSRLVVDPSGGGGWGCRYQIHLLGFWAYPLWLGIQDLATRRLGRAVSVGVVSLSMVLQLISCALPEALEYMQLMGNRVNQLDLMTGGLESGELSWRLQNLKRALTGSTPSPQEVALPDFREGVEKMWARYVPNFWGPVYAKRLDSSAARLLAWLLWSALIPCALVLTVRGLSQAPAEVDQEEHREHDQQRVQHARSA
jgi:hypothetical protein